MSQDPFAHGTKQSKTARPKSRPSDPFARNDTQDKVAKGISVGVNLVWTIAAFVLGAVLLVLGITGGGGPAIIVVGVVSIAVGAYNLWRPFKL